jgi:hypothetical protein
LLALLAHDFLHVSRIRVKPRKVKYLVLQKPDSLADAIMWSHYLVDLFMKAKVSINYFHL